MTTLHPFILKIISPVIVNFQSPSLRNDQFGLFYNRETTTSTFCWKLLCRGEKAQRDIQ